MKTLFVLRHAKSSWSNSDVADFDRPLNERGEQAAPFMGAFMREKNFIPDLILSSPAQRARETARLVKEAGKFDAAILFEPQIYEASLGDLIEIIGQTENNSERLLLVGHNPGLENLVRILTGKAESFPTAALAHILLKIENWSEIQPGKGELENLFKPKELAE
jgi:phosphohistidine phosphatase